MNTNEEFNFLSTLFEKSKILNDMNNCFLKDISFGKLTTSQQLELFYKNTVYHEHILKAISDIVKYVDKTPILLPNNVQKFLKIYDTLTVYTKGRLELVVNALKNTQFIPKNLSTCPNCGSNLLLNKGAGCKKYPLIVGSTICGYTYKCIKIEENLE